MKREVPGPAKRLKEPDPRNAALLLRCFQLSYCSGGHESALPQGPERAAKTAGARVHNRDRESPTVICRQLKNQPRIRPSLSEVQGDPLLIRASAAHQRTCTEA